MKDEGSEKVALVIVTYKEILTFAEIYSLENCMDVLGRYPIVFVTGEGMGLAQEVRRICDVRGAILVTFPATYFSSIDGYNRLLLNKEFFVRFASFKFILIYQLDCLVFSDELENWCAKGFDYIGPPWPALYTKNILDAPGASMPRRLLRKFGITSTGRVGNGGFSLRKVKPAINALTILRAGAERWNKNEDIFWSYYVNSYLPWFRVADYRSALSFGFEINPEQCFAENGNRLPFGCHKWNWHGHSDFWRRMLKIPDSVDDK